MISLLMPTYNSLSGRYRGHGFLDNAISSLRSQSFTDFELLILDNQSSDDTFEHCATIAAQDSRIRVIRDVVQRSPEEAIRHLSELSESKYCAIVNDDDLWDHRYFETLISLLESDHRFNLAYTNGRYISPSGRRLGRIDSRPNAVYSSDSTFETNYRNYLKFRNPVPISFGVFRRESFVESYPTKVLDSYGMNLDNIFIANFIRLGNPIVHVDSDLFFYRERKRISHFDRLGETHKPTPCGILIELVAHQLRVAFALISSGNQRNSELNVDWANREIVLSTLESIEHLTTFVMMEYSLSFQEFRQVKQFRMLIGELANAQSIEMNNVSYQSTTGRLIYDLLEHLKNSSERAFGESEGLRIPLQSLHGVMDKLQI